MRFQRLSHGGSHWGFRKLILKRCQPDTGSTIKSNQWKCMSTSGQAEEKHFIVDSLELSFLVLRFFEQPHWHNTASSCLMSRLLPLASLLTSLLSQKTFVLSDETSVLSHLTCLCSVVTFFFRHTGSHVLSGEGSSRYLSGDFDDGWQSGRGLAKSFKGHETSAPPLLMVMNGALALTLPPPYFMLFSLYTFNYPTQMFVKHLNYMHK